MAIKKPMLASDWNPEKVYFPCIAQPKIDGVRGLVQDGQLTGRSLKALGNHFLADFFGHDVLDGCDGELAAEHECHPRLCNLTTSATSTREGEPFVLWWLFDLVNKNTDSMAYHKRYAALVELVARLQRLEQYQPWAGRLRVVPSVVCKNLEELEAVDAKWLAEGYEGTIIRDPDGMHKQGRSTVREGGLLRIKRFVQEEAVVLSIEEGQTNTNAKETNELGNAFRSTLAAGMVPNGMVGALICRDIKTHQDIKVAAGRLTHDERLHYFNNPNEMIGKTIKYNKFPKGEKDKPRFPTYQGFRNPADM